MGIQRVDKLDKQILKMIAEDARVPFLEVARACGVSGAAIHQRIQKLTQMGVVKGTKYVFDPEKLGYETYNYDCEVTHADGVVDTYISGKITITGESK